MTSELVCPMCGSSGSEVFVVADVWHCDECQASGEFTERGLEPTDAENSSRTRVVRHIARFLSKAHNLEQDEAETIVRYVLDQVKWGLPR